MAHSDLFTPQERDYLGPSEIGESLFDWVDRSARLQVEQGRFALEKWYKDFPEKHRDTLRSRIHSGDDQNFESAMFELFLHQLFSRLGFEVDVEPVLAGGSRPDFLLQAEGKPLCYVEATTDRGLADRNRSTEDARRIMTEMQQHVTVPGFSLLVTKVDRGKQHPSPRRLGRQVNDWLKGLDHAAVVVSRDSHSALPEFELCDARSGWCIDMQAVPLKDPTAVPARLVGALSTGAFSLSPMEMRSVISRKMRQHATTALPVLVAISFLDFASRPDEDDLLEVQLGELQYVVPIQSNEDIRVRRKPNGLWTSTNGTTRRRGLGILSVMDCYVWSLPKVRATLWQNPSAMAESFVRRWPLSRCYWNANGEFQRDEGSSPWEIVRT